MNQADPLFDEALPREATLRKIAPVMQSEMAECGLACLAMVLSAHGKQVPLATLRARHKVSRDGLSLYQLIRIASEYGATARPLSLGMEHLRQLRRPAILFWNNHHFVVLEAVRHDGIEIVDPAIGRRRYGWGEAARYFSGAALELIPGASFTRESAPASAKAQPFSLGALLRANPWIARHLALLAALAILVQLVGVAAPKLFSITVDEVIVKSDTDLLYVLLYVFGAFFAIKFAAASLRVWLESRLRVAVNLDASTGLLAKLLRAPYAFFERRSVADLLRRTQAVDMLHTSLISGWIDIAIDLVFGAVFLVLIATINLELAAVSLLVCTVFLALRKVTMPLMERLHARSIDAQIERDGTFIGTLVSIDTIKQYGYESAKVAAWANQQAATEVARAKVERMQQMTSVIHEALGHAHSLLLCWLGAKAVLAGDNSVGDLFAFVMYKDLFMNCALRSMERYSGLRILEVEKRRLDDVVHCEQENQVPQGYQGNANPGADPIERLAIENGTFAYGAYETPVFERVSLAIERRGKCAIYGASGCGKSTLLRVLAGLYALDAGRVSVNGIELERVGLSAYRRQVALIAGNEEMLDRSVRDNITLDEELDVERLDGVVAQCGLAEAIRQLPNGYNTLLGAGGVQLSSGQRQRILLARALYRRPEVLLLDEPTTHLDGASRDHIVATITQLQIKCVIATHDPALAGACDQVYTMRDGTLHARGADVRRPA
ncbi:peptidase domain-containing ABC transporter [Pseudoxanthomonas sp.]|jgi:ATP-binding cassette subfamily B protein RaxB|uniref:peptidase domain-containing ABC transporter n=1 Tax=Pseudoxanthomonas sp. TaxID=1871049 RepID=UPI002E14B87E|nr:peptidase domain-containing ABC transporter [Pseudoxanthomonas sp.]